MDATEERSFYLATAREYARKAREAEHPGVQAALEAVAGEYLRRASLPVPPAAEAPASDR